MARQYESRDFFTDIESYTYNIPAALDWSAIMEEAQANKGLVKSKSVKLLGCKLNNSEISYMAQDAGKKFISTYTGSVFLLDSKNCSVFLVYHVMSSHNWIGGLKFDRGILMIQDGYTGEYTVRYNPLTRRLN